MEERLQPLAVFDFDDTLIHGDSMWTFFAAVAGWPKVAVAFYATIVGYGFKKLKNDAALLRMDRGTYFKQQMLQRLIKGQRADSFTPIAKRMHMNLRWNDKMVAALREHYEKGHHVVIASGSLDLYLPELVKDLPHHALLCTTIEIVDGVATDVMSEGNCVRKGKAARVEAYIKQYGPFGESWGYGNFPDDVPMMNLMKYRVIV